MKKKTIWSLPVVAESGRRYRTVSSALIGEGKRRPVILFIERAVTETIKSRKV